MDKNENNESWISILVPFFLLVVAIHFMFDYNSKTERNEKLKNELENTKTHLTK